MKPSDSKSSKKPYHRPCLLIYGDLRTLTQGIGSNKIDDNGMMAKMMERGS